MDLSKIGIRPRVRNNWEAIDLGFIMARSWWRVAFLTWFIPAFVTYCILTIIFIDSDWLAPVLTWWLKPLWDRGPLYVASRRLFGEDVSVRDFLKQMPRLYKTDLIPWLTWRRLSLTRSFDMPITLLEQLKGEPRRKRMHTLHLRSSNAATWLTLTCVHLEVLIWMGCLGFFMLLVPEQVDVNVMDLAITESTLAMLIENTLMFLCEALIGPFYAIAGFALYINRRIELEAWDLEVRFRHLAETHKQRRGSSLALWFLMSFAVALCWQPTPSYAQTTPEISAEKSKQLIDEVLQGEDFYNEVTVTRWRLKQQDQETEDTDLSWLEKIIRWLLEHLFDGEFKKSDSSQQVSVPQIVEAILWIAAILVIGYLLYRILIFYDVLRPRGSGTSDSETRSPDVMFGLDVREQSLPEDVAGQALDLWQQGRHREAIGLLYRSTLSVLIHRHQFQFNESHTEQECALIVTHSADNKMSDFVTRMTRTWQMLAYAHRLPEAQQVQALCNEWPEVMQNEK